MKRYQILATLLGVVALLITSCGTGDKIGSVTISAVGASGGVVNLAGLGGTLQLTVTANYTSGKTIDETNFATFAVTPQGFLWDETTPVPTPPLGMTISKTGMVTAVDPGICTWYNAGTVATPGYFFTGDYEVIATYRGIASQPIYIPVASSATGQSGQSGQCGPSGS